MGTVELSPNVAQDRNGPGQRGKTCELDWVVIDLPAFVQHLHRVKYDGSCSLEYEKDMKDPMAGIAESVGYFRGVCDASRPARRKS